MKLLLKRMNNTRKWNINLLQNFERLLSVKELSKYFLITLELLVKLFALKKSLKYTHYSNGYIAKERRTKRKSCVISNIIF